METTHLIKYQEETSRRGAGGYTGLSLLPDCQHHQDHHLKYHSKTILYKNKTKMLSLIKCRVEFLHVYKRTTLISKACHHWGQLRGFGLDLTSPGKRQVWKCCHHWGQLRGLGLDLTPLGINFKLAWRGTNWLGISAMSCRRLTPWHCPLKHRTECRNENGLITRELANFDRVGPANQNLDGG